MYAWKCWRDSRRITGFAVLFQIGLMAVAFFANVQFPHSWPLTVRAWQAWESQQWMGIASVWLYMLAILSVNLPSTSFLLTRPITRRRMIWTGLGMALAEFVVIFVLSGISAAVRVSHGAEPVGEATPTDLSLFNVITLNVLGYILAAGIVRQLFVFSLLLLSRRRKAIWVMGTVWACLFFLMFPGIIPHHALWLPTLVPKVVLLQGDGLVLHSHIAAELAIRGALVLLLAFASQKALQAKEV